MTHKEFRKILDALTWPRGVCEDGIIGKLERFFPEHKKVIDDYFNWNLHSTMREGVQYLGKRVP